MDAPVEKEERAMKKTPEELALSWLRQGKRHLASCSVMMENGYFEQVCFHSQQAAARSLTSLVFLKDGRRIHSPSCIRLIGHLEEQHPSLGAFKESAGLLDQVYASSRYPDDELQVAPYELFPRGQAEDLMSRAGEIVEEAGRIIDRASPSSP